MTTTPGSTKKKSNKAKDIETFLPPPYDIELHQNVLFNAALENDYQTICGAYDCKDHPLATYINNENLFNKRNDFGKTPFDIVCCIGNYEFLKTLLERAEKLGPDILDFKRTNSNGLNCLHHACIWGRIELCKLIIHQSGALGSALLKMKTVNNETPKDVAARYNQQEVVDFLEFAEIRQTLIDSINNLKEASSDVEKTVGRLTKEDRKRIDRLYADSIDWLEKSKDDCDLEQIKQKKAEVQELVTYYTSKLSSKPGSAISRLQ